MNKNVDQEMKALIAELDAQTAKLKAEKLATKGKKKNKKKKGKGWINIISIPFGGQPR